MNTFRLGARGASYSAQWSLTPEQERQAFESFIDFVMARLEQYPDLHIYHYNHYETTALKRLMGRYGTREDEVDRLLRGGVFVDLYRVVRNGLRASVESYSIKKLEPFYGYDRVVDMREANQALANFCASLELGLQTTSDAAIEGYNRDDCVSTLRLRDWLETLRTPDMPRPVRKDPDPEAEQEQQQEEVARLVAQLMALGTREGELLAHLLEYHRREKKTWWWDYYRRKGLAADEILEERTMIGGLELVDQWKDPTPRARSTIYRYRYPRQEHSLKVGDKTENPAVDKQGTGEVVAVDDVACTIDLKRATVIEHPAAIMEYDYIGDKAQRQRLFELGEAYVCAEARGCAVDLLHVRPDTVLGIQGPPGAGKTYTAARMIVDLLREGKRVGVTANSHKVIGKLLDEVCEAAAEKGVVVNGIQKADDDDWCQLAVVERTEKTAVLAGLLAAGTKTLAAGTAWLWASADMAQSVDVLFIDEAGQFSLADALAVAHATEKLVLLGDPQQLDKPQKGAHPPGVAVSALGHMLGEYKTMPAERGMFLEHTWRLPKAICAFTSELFYEGRLEPRPGALDGDVQLVAVEHAGNSNESPEEAAAVAELVATLCNDGYVLDDILIVAPYNLQVAEIAERLPGARVGTVDKFQGQEAKVAIYSMATSSATDAPRGMKFLYSPNRFNVATSRAKQVAVVVAAPEVFAPECKTPEQMRFANAFCRYLELAQVIELGKDPREAAPIAM